MTEIANLLADQFASIESRIPPLFQFLNKDVAIELDKIKKFIENPFKYDENLLKDERIKMIKLISNKLNLPPLLIAEITSGKFEE